MSLVSAPVGPLNKGFAKAEAIGDYMVPLLLHPRIASSVAILAWLSGFQAFAAPTGGKINFTPPLATAKTIQVTEVVWEAKNGLTPGPLHQSASMTFRIQRPDKFRVEMKESTLTKPASYFISDGQTMVGYDGKQLRSQPTAHAEWPFPLMGLLNNMPGSVLAVPAVRDGKKILLAVQGDTAGRSEYWFDPKTHLLVRWMMFVTWQGKTIPAMRTDFSGWVLNKAVPPSVFHMPSSGAKHK